MSPDPSQDPQRTIDHPAARDVPETVDVTGAFHSAPTTEPAAQAPPGRWPEIPEYAITGEIARGGMGRVLAAQERTLQREVAIKVLLPGANAERFVTESKITARLPHPNIPPVYALGTLADGSPYLAMKLIRGRTLADELKSRTDVHAELPHLVQVFEQIALAVGFAHAQRIIHRDLKPANVMLGAFGEVQVMDWGLARELGTADCRLRNDESNGSRLDQTLVGQVMGTPAYMAPEQARGEQADARADVFALGGILSAMLTGKSVFSGTTARETIARAAAGDTAEVIARLKSCGADAELIGIAKQCLASAADARPADGRAVSVLVAAYRQGVEERLKRAESERAAAQAREQEQRKRRQVVQVGAGIIAAVLLLGIIGTTLGLLQAQTQEGIAKARAEGERLATLAAQDQERKALKSAAAEKDANEQTQRGNKIILDIFDDLDIRSVQHGRYPLEAVLSQRLVKAADQLTEKSVGGPLAVARLQIQLAQSLRNLGFADESLPLFQRGCATLSEELGPKHADTLEGTNNLAEGYRAAGKLDLAVPLFEETLRLRKATLGPNDRSTLASMNNLAGTYREAGQLELAATLAEEARDLMKVQLGPNHIDTVSAINTLALIYLSLGKPQQAVPLLEESLQGVKMQVGPDHHETLVCMNNLASGYNAAGQWDLALPVYEETFKITKTKLGPEHPDTLASMGNLAAFYLELGKLDLALPLLEEAAKLTKAKFGPDHPDTLLLNNHLANGYRMTRQFDLAIPLMVETLKLTEARLTRDHPQTLATMNDLALCYKDAGKLDLAVPLYEETLKRRRKLLGDDHPDIFVSMNNLASAYGGVGKVDEALSLLEEAMNKTKARFGPDHPSTLIYMNNLASAYLANGRNDEALPLIEDYFQRLRKQTQPGDSVLASQLADVSERLLKADSFAPAEPLLREALPFFETAKPEWLGFYVRSLLGRALLGQKKYEEAGPLLSAACEGLQRHEATIPEQGKVCLPQAIEGLIELYTATDKPEEVKKWQTERAKYLPPKK